jgi:putative PIN family toxin of toxin-antitoxin system
VTDAVLDTNVLASGVSGEGIIESTPGELFRRWLTGRFELFLSEHILTEFARTMTKPYYRARLTPDQMDRAVRAFRKRGHVVTISVAVAGVATHPADDVVLATAVSAGVPFLVSGDQRLLGVGVYRGVRIVTPKASLDLLDRAAGPAR